jgi:hypothetical protein
VIAAAAGAAVGGGGVAWSSVQRQPKLVRSMVLAALRNRSRSGW